MERKQTARLPEEHRFWIRSLLHRAKVCLKSEDRLGRRHISCTLQSCSRNIHPVGKAASAVWLQLSSRLARRDQCECREVTSNHPCSGLPCCGEAGSYTLLGKADIPTHYPWSSILAGTGSSSGLKASCIGSLEGSHSLLLSCRGSRFCQRSPRRQTQGCRLSELDRPDLFPKR